MITPRPLKVRATKRSFMILGILAGIVASGCSSSNPPIDPATQEKVKESRTKRMEKGINKADPTGKISKMGPRGARQ